MSHFFGKERNGKKTPPPEMGVSEGTYRRTQNQAKIHDTKREGSGGRKGFKILQRDFFTGAPKRIGKPSEDAHSKNQQSR